MTSVANIRQYEYPTTIAERSSSRLPLSRFHACPAACSAVLSRLLLVGRSCRHTNGYGLGALTLGLLHQLATFFVRLGFIHTFVSLSQPVGLAFDTSAAGISAKGSDERDETKRKQTRQNTKPLCFYIYEGDLARGKSARATHICATTPRHNSSGNAMGFMRKLGTCSLFEARFPTNGNCVMLLLCSLLYYKRARSRADCQESGAST